jgi:hypothetical protein
MDGARKLEGEKLEECRQEIGRLEEASEEGLPSNRAVVKVMINTHWPADHFQSHKSCEFAATCCHRQQTPASQFSFWYYRSPLDVTFLLPTPPFELLGHSVETLTYSAPSGRNCTCSRNGSAACTWR